MSSRVLVADAAAYLEQTGWVAEPDTWRGATIWSRDGHQVLVPAQDDMGDSTARMQELLGVVASVEQRDREDVELAMASPLADTQSFQLFPAGVPSGTIRLEHARQSLTAIRSSFGAVARSMVEGPRRSFPGRSPKPVTELVRALQLSPARAGSYIFAVRVPLAAGHDSPPVATGRQPGKLPLGRRTMLAMGESYEALARAAHSAQIGSGSTDLDDVIELGGSADVCDALGRLAGPDGDWPFAVGFRWGHALPSGRLPSSVSFGPGAGRFLHAAAARLREPEPAGQATVTGRIEGLVDNPAGNDRWRIFVRGSVSGDARARTEIWVRLRGEAEFDRAIEASQTGATIQASGWLRPSGRRTDLEVDSGGLIVIG